MSQIKANKYRLKLKKIIDQKKLKTSCKPNTDIAKQFGFLDINTKYKAKPIRIYKIVQTIGNSHPGGDKKGLLIVANVAILLRVNKAESPPTASGIAIQIIKVL